MTLPLVRILNLILSDPGQIAALAGGETGNKSPLAIEMLVSLSLLLVMPLIIYAPLSCGGGCEGDIHERLR